MPICSDVLMCPLNTRQLIGSLASLQPAARIASCRELACHNCPVVLPALTTAHTHILRV